MKDLGNGIKIEKDVFTSTELKILANVQYQYNSHMEFNRSLEKLSGAIDNVLIDMYNHAKYYKVSNQQNVVDAMSSIQLARDSYVKSVKEILKREDILKDNSSSEGNA